MKQKKGFTLIELMMVTLIIAILAALSIPRYMKSAAKAKKNEAMRVLKQISMLEEAYYMEFGIYQASTGPNEIPNICWSIPTNHRRYNYTVEPGTTGDIRTSMFIVATEMRDADNDGNENERITMNEIGIYDGDWLYE